MLDQILKDRQVQAILITDPYNMRHVSGFRGGEGALYISGTQTVLITQIPDILKQQQRKAVLPCSRSLISIKEKKS